MKFTIAYTDLQTLLKGAGVSKPRKADTLSLFACAGRVFAEYKGDVAGIEELVLEDGGVTLPAQKFAALIQTYKGTRLLRFEGSPTSLKVQNFTMPILEWNEAPRPPAQFQLFPTAPLPEKAANPSPQRL